jgi:RHS repeat-associated protein
MEVKQGGNTILVRWYLSGSFIKETTDSVTKEFTFIGGDSYTAPVVAITQSDTTRYYYILRDYLGNITHIVNSSNNEVVAEYSFDAWGRMRDPSTWINYAPGSEPSLFVAGRGYTGHEHLPWFNIINMNGRIYDPLTGMFLSPDNYVQSPTSTQSYNRYAYCWNNPLKYSDPTGEKLKWWHWLLGDLFTGGLISSTAAITATQISVDLLTYHATATITVQSIKSVLVPLDYTVQFCNTLFSNDYYAANSRFQNAIKIDFGLFQTDPNLSGGDRVWQLISRFTWEHLQTELGRTYTHARNMVGDVDRVDYFGGATFATKENYTNKYGFPSSNGISIGNYINISIGDEIAGDCESYVISNPLYMHEYGHTFDSRSFGMSYLFFVGLPSLISAGSAEQVTDEISGVSTHDFKWYEMNANKHAAYYFGKYYGVDWYTRFLRGTFETYYPRKKRK